MTSSYLLRNYVCPGLECLPYANMLSSEQSYKIATIIIPTYRCGKRVPGKWNKLSMDVQRQSGAAVTQTHGVVHGCSVPLSCLTLCDPMDCSPTDSSVLGILQTRILEWVAVPSSRGSSQPRVRTWIFCISCVSRQILYPLSYLGRSINWVQGFLFGYFCSFVPSSRCGEKEREGGKDSQIPSVDRRFTGRPSSRWLGRSHAILYFPKHSMHSIPVENYNITSINIQRPWTSLPTPRVRSPAISYLQPLPPNRWAVPLLPSMPTDFSWFLEICNLPNHSCLWGFVPGRLLASELEFSFLCLSFYSLPVLTWISQVCIWPHCFTGGLWKLKAIPVTLCWCCSVTKLCLTLCDPVDCSMPVSSVLHYLLEFAQIYLHWIGDLI